MSELIDNLILRPLKIYVVNTGRWHHALSEYFKILESGTNPDGTKYWIVGFEDLDILDPVQPDWDYNQPKIRVDQLDQNTIKITGLSYSARFHNMLYYGNHLIFDLPPGERTNFGEKTIPIVLGMTALEAVEKLVLQRLLVSQVINVDTLETEDSLPGEIDTSTETPPKTILTPPSGMRISTRGAYIFTDSSAGEIEIRYKNTGKKIAKLYCSKFYSATLPIIHTKGETDEPIEITWGDLSPGSKIFYLIAYKLTT